MANLLEYVGSVHIYLGPYRGNPIALYLKRSDAGCQIGPKVYPWNDVVGMGDSPNKAAADFEDKWKAKGLSADMYSGPSWEGGIKPERPAPPKRPLLLLLRLPLRLRLQLLPGSRRRRPVSRPANQARIQRDLAFSQADHSAVPVFETAAPQDAEVCFNAFADNRLWLRP
jgi:hypothetical protein